ncbi:MAG: YgaP family membrane protein [Vibrio sp.]
MTIENGVRVLAGSMILLSVILTWWVHSQFLWLTVLVGINLIQSAFTGFCPVVLLLKKLGLDAQ